MHPKVTKIILRVKLFVMRQKGFIASLVLSLNGCIKSSFLEDWSPISKLARQLVQKTLNPKTLGFFNLEKPKIKTHTHTHTHTYNINRLNFSWNSFWAYMWCCVLHFLAFLLVKNTLDSRTRGAYLIITTCKNWRAHTRFPHIQWHMQELHF
jgi:hypothetical protein